MNTFDPNNPFPDERPRSSPIPGVSDRPVTTITSSTWQPAPPPGGPIGGWTPVRRRRNGWLTLVSVGLPLLITGAVAFMIFSQVSNAVGQVTDQFDGSLSGDEVESLGLDVDATTLFDPAAAPALVSAFDAALAGSPTEFSQVILYPDYAIVVARDPEQPSHLDQYLWRGGEVTGPTPQSNVEDVEAVLFDASEVDWAAVGALAARAAELSGVEQGEVTHVMADRTFGQGNPLAVRIYVSGPRDSAYLQVSPEGEVVAIY